MFGLLIALVLLAPAVCAVVPPVVAAGTVMSAARVTPYPSTQTDSADCDVAARSAGDAARSGRIEDEGCAGGGPVRAGGPVRILPIARVLRAVPVVPAGL